MQLFEMQGLLAGKCLPGDMFVGESLAQYFLRQFNQRDELARQVSALQTSQDNIINGLGIKGDGPVSKLVIERVMGLVAENVALKDAFKPSDIPSELTDVFGDTAVIAHDSAGDNQGHSVSWSWVGNQEDVIKAVLSAVSSRCETPTTDAAIAEIESSGAEKMFNLVEPVMRNLCNPAIVELAIEELESLSANLRAGRKV